MAYPYQCKDDEFFEIHTFTCMHCRHLCDPLHQTPAECAKECPNYKARVSKQPTTQHIPVQPGSLHPKNDSTTPTETIILAFGVTISLLILLVFIIICLCRLCKRRALPRDEEMSCGFCYSQQNYQNEANVRPRDEEMNCGFCYSQQNYQNEANAHDQNEAASNGRSSRSHSLRYLFCEKLSCCNSQCHQHSHQQPERPSSILQCSVCCNDGGGCLNFLRNNRPQHRVTNNEQCIALNTSRNERTYSVRNVSNEQIVGQASNGASRQPSSHYVRIDPHGNPNKKPIAGNEINTRQSSASKNKEDEQTVAKPGETRSLTNRNLLEKQKDQSGINDVNKFDTVYSQCTDSGTDCNSYSQSMMHQSLLGPASTKQPEKLSTSVHEVPDPYFTPAIETSRLLSEYDDGCSSVHLSLRSLRSTDENIQPQHAPAESAAEAGHWSTVMRIYDIVDQHLHEWSWVAGCVVGTSVLKVIIDDSVSNNLDLNEYKQKLRNVIPHDIVSARFEATCEGVTMRPCCGNYGAGSLVHVQRAEHHQESATLTLLGRSAGPGVSQGTYAFTVAHLVHSGEYCATQCKCNKIKDLESGICISHADTVGKHVVVRNIKHRIYDMAMVKLHRNISVQNTLNILWKGQSVSVRIRVSREALTRDHLHKLKKVFIFGGPNNYTLPGVVNGFTTVVEKTSQGRKQVVNLIEIRHPDNPNVGIIQAGHSGSLVAWQPDESINAMDGSLELEAFAYMIGFDEDEPAKAWAVSLWDQMAAVFSKDMHGLKETMIFDDFEDVDSGIYTMDYDRK